MIYQLKEGERGCIRPLFERLRYNLVIDSVIDGNTPAWVYADDPHQPRTAWMWNCQDAILLAGYSGNDRVNEALGDLFARNVIPDAVRRHIPDLSLHNSPQSWQGKTDPVLRGARPVKTERRFYTFRQPVVDWRAQLPPGYRMERLDEALLADASLQHIRPVVGWVRSFWHSIPDFVGKGFGFCLLRSNVVVSWCLSVYASGEHYELGLATVPDFQNRGFATLVAAACVELCDTHRWTPHWHCWQDNLPSIAVAEKIGFGHPTTYEVLRFPVDA